jgi:polar amino acid transport system ATP-binding protein
MLIKISNLYKKHDNKTILNNINIEVPEGNILFLKGASGVGKTTLLKIIAKIIPFDSGSITYNSTPIHKLPPGSTGLVFQNFNLFSHMNVLENIILPQVLVLKKDYEKAKIDAEKVLCEYGIEKKRDRYPKDLSGGEQQRVAIIRTLLLNPKIVCFDEPFSALDQNRIGIVLDVIKKLQKEGAILFLTTHNEDAIKELHYKTFLLQ